MKEESRIAGIALALALLGAAAWAQGTSASPSSQSDEEAFGQPETVAPAAASSQEAENKSGFLTYDQVKVGGSFTGSVGMNSIYDDAWGGGARLFRPDQSYLAPDVEGRLTITAKPTVDFGVNMEFYTYWPYYTTSPDYLTGAVSEQGKIITTGSSVTIPYIDVWSLYAKTNWQDKVYFSFGKQPIAWGVSKGAFQPADDIFAASALVDLTDTTKEREGPLALKMTVPLGATKNFYFYADLPTSSEAANNAPSLTATGASTTVDASPADARLAAKAEFGSGDTELALAGFYSYNDHPRALLMGTTSLGSWNIFGEGIAKYGSSRYFLTSSTSGAQQSGDFYFTGDLGGYYYDADSGITLILQYLYNGEAQSKVSAGDALLYYIANPDEYDSAKLGAHYAFVSLSDANLFPVALGKDKLGASLIAISNLSDLSGYVIPSISWTFFDYMILKLGAILNFGGSGSEYISYGVGQSLDYSELSEALPSAPGAALTASLTICTGKF